MAHLRASNPEVHGLIVGDVHPRRRQFLDALQERVSGLGLGEVITFTGHRADLKEIMAISDIVLSLSREQIGRAHV